MNAEMRHGDAPRERRAPERSVTVPMRYEETTDQAEIQAVFGNRGVGIPIA